MKRIQYHRYGGPEEMGLENYQLPGLNKGEILVSVRAASINPVDWKMRQGVMKFMTGRKFPRAMGQDFSGIVTGIGPGVTRFRVGDEVLGTTPMTTSGSFAESLITKEKLTISKPVTVSHEVAATLPVAAGTAWVALVKKGRLRSGQRVFINGAFGAVGQAATQIAKALGAKVVGRVGSGVLTDAKAAGMEAVLDYNEPIPADLAHDFDVVLDCHGSLSIAQGNMLRAPRGVIVDTNPTPGKMLRALFSLARKVVMGGQDTDVLEQVATLAGKGELKINIRRTVRLHEAIDLITALETGVGINGKAVVLMK